MKHYGRIFDAIESGDSKRARLVMKEHLDKIADDLLHRYTERQEAHPNARKGDLRS
jgi:DNA-binding FadR family transcriptional regulator